MKMKNLLDVENLHTSVGQTKILNGINLSIKPGEIHTIMGPNGSGKSSLALTIVGHPQHRITSGSIKFFDQEIVNLSVAERSQKGIFLSFQNPSEVEGVSIREFLYAIQQNKNPVEFERLLTSKMDELNLSSEFVDRSVNYKFSGGEKKQAEILQLAMIKPRLAILDEIDSGLDIDALKTVCKSINNTKKQTEEMSILIITHYPRILNYLATNVVHVMDNGKIVKSGDKKLADLIEKEGYTRPPR